MNHSQFTASEQEILLEFQQAINDKSIFLVFQPKMKKNNGVYKLHGLETLMRWISPKMGFVSPAVFIPLAEKAGLMPQLDTWLISEVGRAFQIWKQEGIQNIVVSINISANELHNSDLPEKFLNTFAQFEVKPRDIILEITESSKIVDVQAAIDVLQKLKEYGFGISIDDFCTGYSSLGYLRQFPATEIKVDKSFTDHVTLDDKTVKIIEGLAYIAHHLDLNFVIEGVETQDQVVAIENKFPDAVMQGYFFSKPLSISDLMKFVKFSS